MQFLNGSDFQMRCRAFVDLDQLSDGSLFATLSEGLRLIEENAASILKQGQTLAQQSHVTGPRVLQVIAEDEAGKFLVLMDAVRCPRVPPGGLGKHLRKATSHLARGIYAESATLQMGSFGAERRSIEEDRRAFFLDGPNDVDWIFRNQIIQRREEALYVDYVEMDGNYTWVSPREHEVRSGSAFGLALAANAVELITAMVHSGLTSPEALATIAEKWRGITLADDFQHWQLHDLNRETLNLLDSSHLLLQQEQSVYTTITQRWSFPYHSLDLSEEPVSQQELRDIQSRWYPR